jgi:hypothetical protein
VDEHAAQVMPRTEITATYSPSSAETDAGATEAEEGPGIVMMAAARQVLCDARTRSMHTNRDTFKTRFNLKLQLRSQSSAQQRSAPLLGTFSMYVAFPALQCFSVTK